MIQAATIDEVIHILNQIIADTKKEASPLGYFAVLYCKVTEKVKEGIHNGAFENGQRMEQLDVVFANRYIKAYYEYKENHKPSACWEVAFKEGNNFWLIVLQHLLLGMNAHINLDLGIAAAEVCSGNEIHGLKNDFNKINQILASLVSNVEKALSDVWPTLKWILSKTKDVDTFLIDFSMQTARDGAWEFALELAPMNAIDFDKAVQARDQRIAEITKLVTDPGFVPSTIFKIIRLFERGSVDKKIAVLQNVI
ncbi:DUF5995 family protein [Flavobacterium sp.]|uniref:DUF5995 family protein n=1 Tax=Flavobacterium sp. TaxID=239 RepID=UPI002B4B949B|nr:DUF5995 family protein [Flavobacterium sp.]HLP65142.1 DUF5995 family protein [Flavobacterium sp.]